MSSSLTTVLNTGYFLNNRNLTTTVLINDNLTGGPISEHDCSLICKDYFNLPELKDCEAGELLAMGPQRMPKTQNIQVKAMLKSVQPGRVMVVMDIRGQKYIYEHIAED